MKEKYSKIFTCEENKEKSIDDLFQQVPASCYLDLFNLTKQTSYNGYFYLF